MINVLDFFRKEAIHLVNEEMDAKATKFRIFDTHNLLNNPNGFTLYERTASGPTSTLDAAHIMIALGVALEDEYKTSFETSWTAIGLKKKSTLEHKSWSFEAFRDRVTKVRERQEALAEQTAQTASNTRYVKQLADGTPELQNLKMTLVYKSTPFDVPHRLKMLKLTLNDVALKYTIDMFGADRMQERKKTSL